tara:strand:- start:5443 stop:5727 length:285 start_codon:yes stop_codon:yes gene_type:complete
MTEENANPESETESTEQDIDKTKVLVSAADDLVELVEEIFEDGKIDLADGMSLPKLFTVLRKFSDSWKAKDEILKELKDLSKDELKQLIDEALD